MLNIILASTAEGGIGLNNKMPWSYPEDFKVFKELTLNHPIVMGRYTWESLPKKPLKERDNNVLTKTEAVIGSHQARVFSSIEKLNEYLRDPVTWVIGGASIYEQFAPKCSYVHHTLINKSYPCDTFFNIYEHLDLELVSEERAGKDGELSFRLLFNKAAPTPRKEEFEKLIAEQRRRALS